MQIVTMGTSLDLKDEDSGDTGMQGVSFFGPGDKVWNEIGAKRTAVLAVWLALVTAMMLVVAVRHHPWTPRHHPALSHTH